MKMLTTTTTTKPTTSSRFEHRFGVCVAISFGAIAVDEFVEWVELNRLLGVTEINIYDGNLTASKTADVLDFYQKSGVVRVVPMPPPVPVPADERRKLDAIKVASPASLNDCMMRNMYRYEFVIVVDFDEFIIPRRHRDYAALLAHIDRMYKLRVPHHTYTFRNVYFFKEFGVVAGASPPSNPPLRSAVYRRRVRPSGRGFAPKSFVDPRQCLSVFNHFCYIRLPTSGPYAGQRYLDVSPQVAASHHYRRCTFAGDRCPKLFKERTNDDVTLRFVAELKPRVDAVLRYLTNFRWTSALQ